MRIPIIYIYVYYVVGGCSFLICIIGIGTSHVAIEALYRYFVDTNRSAVNFLVNIEIRIVPCLETLIGRCATISNIAAICFLHSPTLVLHFEVCVHKILVCNIGTGSDAILYSCIYHCEHFGGLCLHFICSKRKT